MTTNIKRLHYTEFRARIYELLDEYDMYCSQPLTSPRVDLEDSIDGLHVELTSKKYLLAGLA